MSYPILKPFSGFPVHFRIKSKHLIMASQVSSWPGPCPPSLIAFPTLSPYTSALALYLFLQYNQLFILQELCSCCSCGFSSTQVFSWLLRCHLLRVAVLGLHSQLLSFIWFCFSFYSFIFVTPCSIWCLNFLTRAWNPWLLHWECGVLTIGPPGKPLILLYFLNSIYDLYDVVLFIIFLNRSIMTGWTGQKIFLFT